MACLRPFFSYYGSKWTVARHYPPPACRTVVEPFAGSAGYSLRHPSRDVVLVEKDPAVAAIWRWLISADISDIAALPVLVKGENLDDFPMPEPARLLMGFWVNQGASAPRSVMTARGMHMGGTGGRNTCDLYRERCITQIHAIRHWQVIEGGYDTAPGIEATWFIDPPYQRNGCHYRHGSAGIDYRELAAWTLGRRGQVIACENEGADWLPFQPFARTWGSVNYGGQKRRVTREAAWFSDSQQLPLFAGQST
jgi:hypothetical protein